MPLSRQPQAERFYHISLLPCANFNYGFSNCSILSSISSSAGSGQVLRLVYEFLLRKNVAILSNINSSAGSGQVFRLVYEFLLCKNVAILSNTNSSAGNHLTECRVSAVSQVAFSCSRSCKSPETIVHKMQCMVR